MIDQRIFPLLETLAASNLDWLVSDILARIEEGHLHEESQEAISAAQKRIDVKEDNRFEKKDDFNLEAVRPFSGDEQVQIAAEIVLTRIGQSLEMVQFSMKSISSLIGDKNDSNAKQPVDILALTGDDGEIEHTVNKISIDLSLESMDQLRLAVKEWQTIVLEKREST